MKLPAVSSGEGEPAIWLRARRDRPAGKTSPGRTAWEALLIREPPRIARDYNGRPRQLAAAAAEVRGLRRGSRRWERASAARRALCVRRTRAWQ